MGFGEQAGQQTFGVVRFGGEDIAAFATVASDQVRMLTAVFVLRRYHDNGVLGAVEAGRKTSVMPLSILIKVYPSDPVSTRSITVQTRAPALPTK